MPCSSHQRAARIYAGILGFFFSWSNHSAHSTGSSPSALLLLYPQKTTVVFELHSQLQLAVWVTGKFNALSALLGNCAQGPRSHSRDLQLPSHELHKGQRKWLPICLTGVSSCSKQGGKSGFCIVTRHLNTRKAAGCSELMK